MSETNDKNFSEKVAATAVAEPEQPPVDRHPDQLATVPNPQYVLQQVEAKHRKQDECEKLRAAGNDCADVSPTPVPAKDMAAIKKRNAERKKLTEEIQKALKEFGQESDVPANHVYWTSLNALRALGPMESEK